jgi:lipid II:glycine glycyltransferase (peptidoglycan interpeptide bridge formation enzyme)
MLKILKPQDYNLWDKYLDNLDNNVMWKHSYYRIYEYEGEPQAAIYEDERGFVFYPYLVRHITDNYFDITTVYGYGGPIINSLDVHKESLFKEFRRLFTQYCKNNHIITEFVRYQPLLTDTDLIKKFITIERKVPNYYLDLGKYSSEDELLLSYKKNCRYMIRKAMNNQVTIKEDHTGVFLDSFVNIYHHTMVRRHAKEFYYFDKTFFERVVESLKDNFVFFYAEYNEQIIAAELMIYDQGCAYPFLGGGRSEYFQLGINNLLTHQSIIWAKKRGIKRYLLGGSVSPDDGVIAFKKSFAHDDTQEVDYYVGKHTFNEEVYKMLINRRNFVSDSIDEDYYPLYRLG